MDLTPADDMNSTTIDHLTPAVADHGGYRLRRRDLDFLRISAEGLDAWRSRHRPLGLSQIQYDGLLQDLRDALLRDGVRLEQCDIRLKGSSAQFFSGAHKQMPSGRDDIIDLFTVLRDRYPADWEIAEIERRLNEIWITDGDLPSQRPFDSFYRLGIERERSDIDLQISSDVLAGRCEALLVRSGQPITEARMKHPVYNFVKKVLVEKEFPELFLFTRRTSDALGRNVSIAVFAAAGPPDVSATDPELSAHLSERDWVIRLYPSSPSAESVA